MFTYLVQGRLDFSVPVVTFKIHVKVIFPGLVPGWTGLNRGQVYLSFFEGEKRFLQRPGSVRQGEENRGAVPARGGGDIRPDH